jgi:hypothetical protein
MSPVDRMRLINKRKDIGKRRRQQSSRIWAAMQQRYQALRNNRDA